MHGMELGALRERINECWGSRRGDRWGLETGRVLLVVEGGLEKGASLSAVKLGTARYS